MRRVLIFIIGLALLSACGGQTKTLPAKTLTVTQTTTVTTTPTQVVSTVTPAPVTVTFTPEPVDEFSDGVRLVGPDIPAGNYKTNGPSVGQQCYYAILNSPDTSDIQDNNIISGPARVTLVAGKYFDTNDGCTWAKV